MAAGEAKSDFWWLVGVICLLGFAWLFTDGPARWETGFGPFINPPVPLDPKQVTYYAPDGTAGSRYYDYNNQDGGVDITPTERSNYFGKIKISSGNAQSESSAKDEYITISASESLSVPVNISGWRLTNNGRRWLKGATIPGGVRLFIANKDHRSQEPIVLAPGETAVVTSGEVAAGSPVPIDTSFKTNICSGYLAELPDYRFTPGMWSNCPRPQNEPIVANLDSECYEVVKYLGACHTPRVTTALDRDNTRLIDGRVLPGACGDFLVKEFNYNACVSRHQSDDNFWSKEWRVFLRQPDELWSKDREVITLYDNFGKIVAQLKY